MTAANPGNLVSIVMPVWQPHAEWFPAAVSSVLAQTDCEFELIIVDDGNDPPVEPPVESGRLRVLRIEHGGCARAPTAGTAEALGRWFRYVDADDVLAPARRRRQRERNRWHGLTTAPHLRGCRRVERESPADSTGLPHPALLGPSIDPLTPCSGGEPRARSEH